MAQAPCVACCPPHEAGAPGVLEGQVCLLLLDLRAPLPTFQLLAFWRRLGEGRRRPVLLSKVPTPTSAGGSASLHLKPNPQEPPRQGELTAKMGHPRRVTGRVPGSFPTWGDSLPA